MIARGYIRAVNNFGYYVESRDLGIGAVFGPCQTTTDVYEVDDLVLVSQASDKWEDVVILGKLHDGLQVDDSIASFPTEAARDAQITSPIDGTLVWIQDINRLTYYDQTNAVWSKVSNLSDITPLNTAISGLQTLTATHTTQIATNASQIATKEPTVASGTTSQYYRGDKTWQTLDKTAVGLANVDNTSDANKPLSTAETTALAGKQATLSSASTVTIGSLTVSTTLNLPPANANLGTQDLNTLKNQAIYNQPSTANATLANNYPVTVAGLLEIFGNNNGSTTGFVYQRYTAYNTASTGGRTMWHREWYNNAWSAWSLINQPTVPHIAAYLTNATQAITASTYTQITLDTTIESQGGMTLTSGYLTVPQDGLYNINAGLRWASNDTGQRFLCIQVGTGAYSAATFLTTVAGSINTVSASSDGVQGSVTRRLTSGQRLFLGAYHNSSTSPINIQGTNTEFSTYMDATWLSP